MSKGQVKGASISNSGDRNRGPGVRNAWLKLHKANAVPCMSNAFSSTMGASLLLQNKLVHSYSSRMCSGQTVLHCVASRHVTSTGGLHILSASVTITCLLSDPPPRPPCPSPHTFSPSPPHPTWNPSVLSPWTPKAKPHLESHLTWGDCWV